MSTIQGSVEANKAAALRWNEEGINGHNIELVDELLHPNYRQLSGNDSPWALEVEGRAAAKTSFQKLYQDLPTVRVTIDDIFGEGQKVALRVTAYVEGKTLGYACIVYRFEDGKIIDDWNCWTMFKQ